MSLRAIKERTNSISVEKDLRGLGSIVRDRPPQYELHVKIVEGKEPELRALALKRGFHEGTRALDVVFFVTPEAVSAHEQAVWHFFLVTEFFKQNLVYQTAIRLVQPIETILTHGMDRRAHLRRYDPFETVSFDASVALQMMRAGYWKTHFSEERIRKDVHEKGFSAIYMDSDKLFILHNEIVAANSIDEKKGHKNAK